MNLLPLFFSFFVSGLLCSATFATKVSDQTLVKVLVVKKEQSDLDAKKSSLIENGCKSLGDFAVNVDLATTMLRQRKVATVQEETHKMQGNVVISSLENDGSLPPRLKGLVYNCPDSYSPQNDIDNI